MVSDQEALQNISANIERLLEARRWTQRELALKTGESENTISRVRRGLNLPLAGLIIRIAEAFDVTIDRLCSPPPPTNSKKAS